MPVIAVDTNILVYAHRADSTWHPRADAVVAELAEGQASWAIPWPCVYEFLAVVTHPRIYRPPTPPRDALRQVRLWLESPSLVLLAEPAEFFQPLERTIGEAGVVGAAVHDARVAALCIQHGVTRLYTADRDFTRFAGLRAQNPLVIPA